jgi:8-oxo-dGTP diphosphatase
VIVAESRKIIAVAVGVMFDPSGERCLVTKRDAGQHLAGSWEWPGGKLEPGETAEEALRREWREELGAEISTAEHIITTEYEYPERTVKIFFFVVAPSPDHPPVVPAQREHAWMSPAELAQAPFPSANLPALRALIARASRKVHQDAPQ